MTTPEVEEILQQINDLQLDIAASETKRDESIAFHQNKIEHAKRIFELDTYEPRQEIFRLQLALEEHFKANPPKKGKSLKYSGGSFGYRKQNARFFFNGEEVAADNPAVVAFVKTFYTDFIKVKEFVDWANFKNALTADDSGVYFKDTGELLDGFSAKIPQDKFVVNI